MIVGTDPNEHVYIDLCLRADNPVRRFTAYAVYPFDKAALALDDDALMQVVKSGGASVEDIDVDAATERHAKEIAVAALLRDYEAGGRVVAVEERIGWYV